MSSFNYDSIRATALKGPRVTSLKDVFEDIASGSSQAPAERVYAEPEFLSDPVNETYHKLLQENASPFFKHLFASIPYVLEQLCYYGLAFNKLAKLRSANETQPFTYYSVSAADGTEARTLAEYSQGIIKTLTDTPTAANGVQFRQLCRHDHSDMYVGPFVDITPEYLQTRDDRPYFKAGFDVVFEAMTFQMYGPNRAEQIAYVRRVLKEDGLFFSLKNLTIPMLKSMFDESR